MVVTYILCVIINELNFLFCSVSIKIFVFQFTIKGVFLHNLEMRNKKYYILLLYNKRYDKTFEIPQVDIAYTFFEIVDFFQFDQMLYQLNFNIK